MSLGANTWRHLFRCPANAWLMAPRGISVRFESSAKTAAKETVRSLQETAKAAEIQKEAEKHIAAGTLKALEYSKQAAAGIAKAQKYSKQLAASLARAGTTAKTMTKKLSESGGVTGRIASAIDNQFPFVVYYSRVLLEMFKMVAQARNMAPPPISTFQSWGDMAISKVTNPSELTKLSGELIQKARGATALQLASVGVILAECLGFFTVGEMIGRFKIVGYRGKAEAHHPH